MPATTDLDRELLQLAAEHPTIRTAGPAGPTRLIIVSGQAFTAWAAAELPETTVVGITTPAEWRGVDGAIHPDLDALAMTGPAVTIALGDYTADATVYAAAEALAVALRRSGSKTPVFLNDDAAVMLDRREAVEQKRAYAEAALADAAAKLGRRPAARKGAGSSQLSPEVAWDRGLIVEKATALDGTPAGETVLAEFAARRLRLVEKRRTALTDAAGEHLHDIEVAVGRVGTPDRREWIVQGVADAQLSTPRAWLNRIPRVGSSLIYAAAPGTEAKIANALRSYQADAVEAISGFERTGWIELETGDLVYLHGGGAIGIDGETNAARAEIPERYQSPLTFPNPAELSSEERAAAVRRLLDVRSEMHRGTWVTAMGVAFYALAGLANRGSVAPYIYGLKGSGKTVTVAGVNSFLSSVWGNRGQAMAKLDGTSAAIRDLSEGLDDLWLTVDDGRDKAATPHEQQVMLKVIDGLARVAYEGGSATAKKMVFNAATKRWAPTTIPWSPAVMITSELIPDELGASTLERFLPVEVTAENAFTSGTAEHYRALTSDSVPQRFTTLFIHWLASQIQAAGGLTEWRERHQAARAELAAEIYAAGGLTHRLAENVAIALTGHAVLVDFLAGQPEVSEIERAALANDLDRMRAELTETVQQWASAGALADATVPPWQQVMTAVRDAVASGSVFIDNRRADGRTHGRIEQNLDEMYERAGVRFIGGIRSVDGRRYLAVIPGVAAELPALRQRFGSSQRIGKALAEVALPGETGRGQGVTRQVRIGRGYTRTILVPVELYNEGAPRTDAEDDERARAAGLVAA